jgi:hypothetical protein
MPKIGFGLGASVFFLFGRDAKTGEVVGPHGTGTFIGRRSKAVPNRWHTYAVTNWHVACRGSSIIGINTHDGYRRLMEFDPSEWLFTNSGDDLAAVNVNGQEDLNDNVTCLDESALATHDIIKEFEISPGEEAFMCGLFLNHHSGSIWEDSAHNVPAFRFGNVSMMADGFAPVEVETGAKRPCFLVDMRSRTGFSGSPVFIYRTIGSDLTQIPIGWGADRWNHPRFQAQTHAALRPQILHAKNTFVGVLGIHCGQFWDTVKAFKSMSHSEQVGDNVRDGDELDIQGSMNIVAPAWCISELLNLEEFEMARRKRDEKFLQDDRRAPRAESAASDATPQSTDANPNHREDFNSLVGEAAQKRERED